MHSIITLTFATKYLPEGKDHFHSSLMVEGSNGNMRIMNSYNISNDGLIYNQGTLPQE